MRDVQTLKSERYILRPLRIEDSAALLPTLSDEAQCLYLTRPAFEDEDQLWCWLAEPGWNGRTWIAVDRAGEVVGRFVAVPGHEDGLEELGYITCMHRQGEGVASECSAALIAHLFTTGTRKVTADVDVENIASVRLIEKLGFTREAHFREHETTHAGLRDVYVYGLLASDFEQG